LLLVPHTQTGMDTPSTSAKDCPGRMQELKTEWDSYQITFSAFHGGHVAPYFNPYIVAVPGQKFDIQYVAALNLYPLNRSWGFVHTHGSSVLLAWRRAHGTACMPIICEAVDLCIYSNEDDNDSDIENNNSKLLCRAREFVDSTVSRCMLH
jgi:hypothetical protein